MDLPEFFRDCAAPSFRDHILEGRGSLELELELEPEGLKKKAYGGSTRGTQANDSLLDDGAYKACLGSLRFDEDDSDDEITLTKPLVRWQ